MVVAGRTDISSTAVWREATDQAAATGQEIMIVGFGAAGYCGLCTGQVSNATCKGTLLPLTPVGSLPDRTAAILRQGWRGSSRR